MDETFGTDTVAGGGAAIQSYLSGYLNDYPPVPADSVPSSALNIFNSALGSVFNVAKTASDFQTALAVNNANTAIAKTNAQTQTTLAQLNAQKTLAAAQAALNPGSSNLFMILVIVGVFYALSHA